MNKELLKISINKFKYDLFNYFDSELDLYFSKDVSDKEYFDFEFSDKKINTIKLDKMWVDLCKDNQWDKADRIFVLQKLLIEFNYETVLFENKINKKISDINNNNRRSHFLPEYNTSFYLSKNYFKAELEEIDKVKVSDEKPEIHHNINNEISWENQTELSELIYVLFHSKKVLKNGKPIQQKDLTELLNKTFNTNIKEPTDLLKKSMTSNKVVYDGKTFISELNSILEVYKKKTLDKDSK